MGITDPSVLALATHAQLKGSTYPLYENTLFPAMQEEHNPAGQVLVSGTSGKTGVNQESRPFDASASPSVTGQLHQSPCSRAHCTASGETASFSSLWRLYHSLSTSDPCSQAQGLGALCLPLPRQKPRCPTPPKPSQSSTWSSTTMVQSRTRDTDTKSGTFPSRGPRTPKRFTAGG